ncbi:MAG: Elp3 protein [Anaerolineales bacterium]|nr:Elp3 protein [Anaerolineales bacterium]
MSWLPGRTSATTRDSRQGRLEVFRRATPRGSATIHLRRAADGRGELFINANQVYRLNPTAAQMANLVLSEIPSAEAVRRLARVFRADHRRLARDLAAFRADLEGLLDPESVCPVHDLNLEVIAPFSEIPESPYRMDLALTYRCNDNCAHCYNARPRTYPELPTEDWRTILDRLWAVGVPHICFTGGEATLRNDLPELVAHSHGLGHIVGLLSNGRRLSDAAFVRTLTAAGLDHVQITLESSREDVHDRMVGARGAWRQTVAGIRNALEGGLFVMTNTTLLADNVGHISETIDFLAEIGVPTIGCNALIHAGHGAEVGSGLPEGSLAPVLRDVQSRTDNTATSTPSRPSWASKAARRRVTTCASNQMAPSCHASPTINPSGTSCGIRGTRSGTTTFHCGSGSGSTCPTTVAPARSSPNAGEAAP